MITCSFIPNICTKHSFYILKASRLTPSTQSCFKILHSAQQKKSLAAIDSFNASISTKQQQSTNLNNNHLNQGPTFQEAISKLQEYWSSLGCAIWLPHNNEVHLKLN